MQNGKPYPLLAWAIRTGFCAACVGASAPPRVLHGGQRAVAITTMADRVFEGAPALFAVRALQLACVEILVERLFSVPCRASFRACVAWSPDHAV